MNKILQSLLRPGFTIMLLVGTAMFLIGWRIAKGPAEDHSAHNHPQGAAAAASIWTCAMHPQIRQPGPGQCPICKMDLIPASAHKAGGLREITVMPETAALMDFRVTPTVRAAAMRELRIFGTVAYDERRVQSLTAWVGGRLDRMFVDFTGTRVRKGDHLAEIYSPDLFSAQQDLIRARQQLDSATSPTQRLLYDAVRERLRLLGIPEDRIDAMEAAKEPADHVVLTAPQDGIVVEKIAREGDYVTTGQKLYTIADLDMVWVNLEAYESDLPWIRFAQDVTFTSDAVPGREFHGRVAFIDPVLDRKRRVVSVRVNVENKDGLLKPGMFVSGRIHSEIDAAGHVITQDLAGKWISPMHPEIIKDSPGSCDICGMKLERAEDLGFVTPGKAGKLPLLVPASAVLRTGERALVYVKSAKKGDPTFEGREIILGARAGDHYIVESGLAEGDLVLTRGAFKLDSELQLQARPSMMNPTGGLPQTSVMEPDAALAAQWPPVHRALSRLQADFSVSAAKAVTAQIEAFDLSVVDLEAEAVWRELSRSLLNDLHLLTVGKSAADRERVWKTITSRLEQLHRYLGLPMAPASDRSEPVDPARIAALRKLLDAFFPIQSTLAGDDDVKAKESAAKLAKEVAASDWQATLEPLVTAVRDAADIKARRAAFEPLSEAFVKIVSAEGHDQVGGVFLMHCPMAFENRGANWLQSTRETANPYFGASMFGCGELHQTLSPPVLKPAAQSPASEHVHPK